jgi:uncharacterized protein YuzE
VATRLTEQEINRVVRSVPRLIDLPSKRFSVDYDEEADVLYLSFRKPQGASDSEMPDDGIIVRTHRGEIVGLTILDASTRTA